MERSYPNGWHKTLEDLIKKGRHSGQEFEWARAYERDQIKRNGVRFPVAGDVYESIHGVEVICMTHWRAPSTGGQKVILPAGTKVKAEVHSLDLEPIGIYAVPIDYERLEPVLVPCAERESENYDGYSISLKTAQLHRDFRLT